MKSVGTRGSDFLQAEGGCQRGQLSSLGSRAARWGGVEWAGEGCVNQNGVQGAV